MMKPAARTVGPVGRRPSGASRPGSGTGKSMTPGARLQAVIDLLDEIDKTPRPADAVISAYFRARRYIGSKDRTAVAEMAYGVLRRHARLGWWLARLGHPPTPRARVVADQILAHGRAAASLDKLFDGSRFDPAPFDPGEARLARSLDSHTLDHPHMPEEVRVECPPWAAEPLRAWAGERFAA